MDLDSVWLTSDEQIFIVAEAVKLDITLSITKLKIQLLKMYSREGRLNTETNMLVNLPEFTKTILNYEYAVAKEKLLYIVVFSTFFNDLNLISVINEFLLNKRIATSDGENLQIRDLYTLEVYNTFKLPPKICRIEKIILVGNAIYFIAYPYDSYKKLNYGVAT